MRLSCQLGRTRLNSDFLAVLDIPGVHQEALGGGTAEDEHLLGAERDSCHRERPHELGILHL